MGSKPWSYCCSGETCQGDKSLIFVHCLKKTASQWICLLLKTCPCQNNQEGAFLEHQTSDGNTAITVAASRSSTLDICHLFIYLPFVQLRIGWDEAQLFTFWAKSVKGVPLKNLPFRCLDQRASECSTCYVRGQTDTVLALVAAGANIEHEDM